MIHRVRQLYRGPAASLPALADGEPGWTTDTHALYVGQGGVNYAVGGGGSGTVTSVSVVTANGLAGSVAAAATTPAITLTTTVTGLLKGDGTALSAAVADVDYATPAGVVAYVGGYAQPLDADLTALAALGGTNTIYYRSGANTWSAVTFGGSLTFSGGVLADSAGTGDVVGPAGATDNAVARYDGVTGKLLQNSTATITDAGTLSVIMSDAITSATSDVLVLDHSSSGTPASGFGSDLHFKLMSTTTNSRDAALISVQWATATDASRKARLVLSAYDATSSRVFITGGTDGSSPTVGFLGATPSAQLASPDLGTLATTFGLASGTPTFALANLTGADDLKAIEALTGTGTIYYRSAANTWSSVTIGANLTFSGGTLSASGTVTSFSAGDLSPLFTSSVATATTTPALTFSLSTQNAATVLAGPASGSAAAPTFRNLTSTDVPLRHNLLANGGCWFFQRSNPATFTPFNDDSYGADRWILLFQNGASQIDRTTGSSGPYALRIKNTQASAQRMGTEQIVEASDSIPTRGRTLRFQFNAKCSATTTLRYAILEWTGTADSVTSDVVLSWTSSTYAAGNFFLAANLTVVAVGSTSVGTSYTACSLSGTVSSSCNNLIVFVWTEATTAVNGTVELAELTLCDNALPRDWLPDPYPIEEARCQRYCLALTAVALGVAQNSTFLYNMGATTLPTTMRIAPTVLSGATYSVNAGSAGTVGYATAATTKSVSFANSAANWTATAQVSVTCVLDAEL